MDFPIGLKPTGVAETLRAAENVEALTAALKAEEKARKSAIVAATRTAAGNDPKQYTRAANAVKEATSRIALLQAESVRLSATTRAGAFAKGLKETFGASGLVKSIKAARDAVKGFSFETIGKGVGAAPGAALSALGAAASVSAAAMGIAATASVGLGIGLAIAARHAVTLGIGFADSARSARLLNDAADIAAGTHHQLSGIIEDVNRRSTIGKDRIAVLGRELRLLRLDSRQTQLALSGMAVAESALGPGAGAAVKGIAEQSRAFRKLSLGARDAYGEYENLKATGLTKADLFAELGKQLKTSSAGAAQAVQLGRVTVTQGLAAIDSALRKKFGGNVAAQAMGIERQFAKMKEDFAGLFTGANIEPLLKGLRSITDLFSQDTSAGRSFGKIVTVILDDLGKTAEALGPDIKEALLQLSAEAAKPGGLATAIRGWINDAKDLGGAIKDIADAIKAIGGAAEGAKDVFRFFVRPKAVTVANGIQMPEDIAAAKVTAEANASGRALTAGIKAGVEAGTPDALQSISALAQAMRQIYRIENKIQSPSKVYAADSDFIPQGAAMGVRRSTPIAVDSVEVMAGSMRAGFDAPDISNVSSVSSRAGDSYAITVNAYGMGSGTDIGNDLARVLRSRSNAGAAAR